MVTIVVRTEDGPIELPVSYRDYCWEDLRTSRRRAQAMELVEQINAIAKGHLYQPPQPPVVADDRRVPWDQKTSSNPYASPAMVDDHNLAARLTES